MENIYAVKVIKGKPEFTVAVPGSKSITNRALLLAAMTPGETVLQGTVYSSDSKVFVEALSDLGYEIEINETNHTTNVGSGNVALRNERFRKVYVGSAGTAARFLTAMLAFSGGSFEVESSEQMKRRPMRPLLEALECLGAKFEYREEPYCFPLHILGYEEKEAVEVPLNIDESSQFLSALLMAGVMRKRGFCIRLTGQRSAKAYVEITKRMMKSFGVEVKEKSDIYYEVPPHAAYQKENYQIEPDVSAACYFYALAALTGGTGTVRHVSRQTLQGDIQFITLLEQMGCKVAEGTEGLCLTGPERGSMEGVTVDMSDFSDQTMTLAAMAPFLQGQTVIKNVGHIRLQESDRLKAITTELKRLGIEVAEKENGLKITPSKIKPATIKTYDDHRMAMAFSLIGCMEEGIKIADPMCCAKTFPDYFKVLEGI